MEINKITPAQNLIYQKMKYFTTKAYSPWVATRNENMIKGLVICTQNAQFTWGLLSKFTAGKYEEKRS